MTYEEFYLYCLLNLLEGRDGVIFTSVKMIESLLPICYSDNPRYNRNKIKEILSNLLEKKIVVIDSHDNLSSIVKKAKLDDVLLIEINDEYIISNSKIKGYEQIPSYALRKAKNMTDLYIYYSVFKWEKSGGLKCSYNRWGKILGVSSRTAMGYIREAVINKAIFFNIGGYKSNSKQNINVYRVTQFEEKEKTKPTKEFEKKWFNTIETKKKSKKCEERVNEVDKSETPF